MKGISTALVAGLAALIAAVSFLVFTPLLALVSCLLGWTMLAIAATDARRFIVPDVLSLPAIPAGLLVAPLLDEMRAPSVVVLEHVAAAVLGAAALYAIRHLYFVLRQREGLGLGDVKLAAVAGAWTGLAGLGHVLLVACALAISTVLLSHVGRFRALRGSTAVAFGVFLAPSIWLVWCLAALGVDPAGLLLAALS
jgi:leader peptidase (prepilin peptidase)/N-methyltransferase